MENGKNSKKNAAIATLLFGHSYVDPKVFDVIGGHDELPERLQEQLSAHPRLPGGKLFTCLDSAYPALGYFKIHLKLSLWQSYQLPEAYGCEKGYIWNCFKSCPIALSD